MSRPDEQQTLEISAGIVLVMLGFFMVISLFIGGLFTRNSERQTAVEKEKQEKIERQLKAIRQIEVDNEMKRLNCVTLDCAIEKSMVR